jgi:hypothetical protein
MAISNLLFVGCLAVLVYLWWTLYQHIVASILSGRAWRAAFLTALTSPVLLLFLATFGENRPFSDFTNLGILPWSVVFGDGLVLPAAVYVAAKSAPAWYEESLATNPWWIRFCLLVGLAAGFGFHQFDGSGYRKAGFGALVPSLTKDWHDMAVYSIFVGMLLYVLVFILKFDRPYRWMFLALLGVQLVLMAIDANRGLNPPDMHSACDIACGAQNLSDHLHAVLGWLQDWLRHVYLTN